MRKTKNYSVLSIWIMCILCIVIGVLVAVISCFLWVYNTPNIKTAFIETYLNEDSSLIKENLFDKTIEFTIPASFFELNEQPFDYQLTEEDRKNGFTNIKKNNDGSATYFIKKDKYDSFIDKLKTETANSIDELVLSKSFSSIENIEYSDKFETITITANKEQFQNGIDSMVITSCGLSSYIYQMFDIDAKHTCIINIKDSTSGEVFHTATYPDALN